MMILKKMRKSLKIFAAYQKYFNARFNVECVESNGNFIIVDRNCSTCKHKKTSYRKHCQSPLSLGCSDFWEYNGGK